MLVGDVFRQAAGATPDRVAASLGERLLTFAQLDARGDRLAGALLAAGVTAGDRLLWWGDPTLDAVPLFAAAAKLGAVFAPVSTRLSPEEASQVLLFARPRIVVAGGRDREAQARDLAAGVAVTTLEALAGRSTAPVSLPAVDLDPEDPHVIFFTSGSTGSPKGVVLSHRASWLRSFAGSIPPAPGATVCMFPLFHMAAWSIALGCWQSRQEVVFVPAPTPDGLLGAVAARRATRLYAIPAVWARILDHDRSGYDTSSLREVDTGTSATPPELIARLRRAFPDAVTRVMYGSTEAGPGTVLLHDDSERKPGSVGLPSAGVELRLTAAGEVCLRGPFLMSGYFDDEVATASAVVDGWYRTGDLGTLDAEGYLSIIGRLREVIRTGGETVAPAEVELVLATHPALTEVAVVGVPDPRWGEVVCAVAVPRPGAAVDLDDLRRHCEGRLARFKHPRRLELVDALPRTAATGQVQRSLLVERLATAR